MGRTSNYWRRVAILIFLLNLVVLALADYECAYGKYGKNCDKDCSQNCKTIEGELKSPCSRIDGTCTFGCKNGQIGIGLYCFTAATSRPSKTLSSTNTTHSPTCSAANQFKCKDGSDCLPLVYKCDTNPDCRDNSDEEGCGETTQAVITTTASLLCDTGFYGRWCNATCSANCVNMTCASEDGTCDCLPTFYGPKCEFNCSIECKDQLCNMKSGVCDKCPLGRMGDHCKRDILNFSVNGKQAIVVEQGDEVIFACHVAKGSQYNTTNVLVENGFGKTSVRPANRDFTVENLTCEDSGRYTCQGIHSLDSASQQPNKSVDVNINCPLTLTDPLPDKEVRTFNITPGVSKNISFEVQGYPPPSGYRLRIVEEEPQSSDSSMRKDATSGFKSGSYRLRDVDKSMYTPSFVQLVPPYGEVLLDIHDQPVLPTRYVFDIMSDRKNDILTLAFQIVPLHSQSAPPEDSLQTQILIIGFASLGGLLFIALIIMSVYCHRQAKQAGYRDMLRDIAHLPGLQGQPLPRSQETPHYVMTTMMPVNLVQPPAPCARRTEIPEYFARGMLHQMDHHDYESPLSCAKGKDLPKGRLVSRPHTSACYDDGYSERPDDEDEVPEYSELDEFQKPKDEDERGFPDGGVPEDDGYETPVRRQTHRP